MDALPAAGADGPREAPASEETQDDSSCSDAEREQSAAERAENEQTSEPGFEDAPEVQRPEDGRMGRPPSMMPSQRATSNDDLEPAILLAAQDTIAEEAPASAEPDRPDAAAPAEGESVPLALDPSEYAPAHAESSLESAPAAARWRGSAADQPPLAQPAQTLDAEQAPLVERVERVAEPSPQAEDESDGPADDDVPPLTAGLSSGGQAASSRARGRALRTGEGSDSSQPPTYGRQRTESVTGGPELEAVMRDAARLSSARRPELARCSSHFWNDAARAQDVADAVQRFNGKARDGLRFMHERGLLAPSEAVPAAESGEASRLLEEEAQAVAAFLHNAKGLSKRKIGDFLGESSELNKQVLRQYTQAYSFDSLSFVDALRAYLTPFRLPGEAQKIDRIMNCFSAHYHAQNPAVFSCEDTAYVLAFSLIMLNTDQHSPHVASKMTLAEFLRNNRGIDRGQDIPEPILSAAYLDIRRTELKTTTEFDELSQQELLLWLQQGSVFTKFTHSRAGALKTPRHEVRLWVADNALRYRNLQRRNLSALSTRNERQIPLASISDVLVGLRSQVFRRQQVRLPPQLRQTPSGEPLEREKEAELSDKAFFSLVCDARTLDLQAATPELGEFWSRFFRQVVERSRLEATARRLALRAQPRERFLEMATKVWSREIVPGWEALRHSERTRMLWWEGIPSSERGRVWLLVLGQSAASIEQLQQAQQQPQPHGGRAEAESAAMVAAVGSAGEWLDEALGPRQTELSQLYGRGDSPFRGDAVRLLARLQLSLAERGVQARTSAPSAPLICGMLLLSLEPPLASVALLALCSQHVPGRDEPEALLWRSRGFELVLRQELPQLHAFLQGLRVQPSEYFLLWLRALFVSTLCIETASRLWDCYMRDGELFAWRVAVEVLRRRGAQLMAECAGEREKALAFLLQPVDPAALPEKALFKSMQEGEDSVAQWLPLLQQKLPLPDPCWDLYANSYDCKREHLGLSDGQGDDGSGAEDGDDKAATEPTNHVKQSRIASLFSTVKTVSVGVAKARR